MSLLQKFALLALMLLLPLQGTAAVIAPVLCLGDNSHHTAQADTQHEHGQPGNQHSAHDHGTPQPDHGTAPGDSGNGKHAGHLCCCHFAATAPVTIETLPKADLPIYQSRLSLLATLHIPELPQRPPRS